MFSQNHKIILCFLIIIIVTGLFSPNKIEGFGPSPPTLNSYSYYNDMSLNVLSSTLPVSLSNLQNSIQNNTAFSQSLATLAISAANFYYNIVTLYNETPVVSGQDKNVQFIYSQSNTMQQLYQLFISYGIDITMIANELWGANSPSTTALISVVKPGGVNSLISNAIK